MSRVLTPQALMPEAVILSMFGIDEKLHRSWLKQGKLEGTYILTGTQRRFKYDKYNEAVNRIAIEDGQRDTAVERHQKV